MLVNDTPTALWSLDKNGRRLTCTVRLTAVGLELALYIDDRWLMARRFQTDADLYAEAVLVKEEWLALGWKERDRVEKGRDPAVG